MVVVDDDGDGDRAIGHLAGRDEIDGIRAWRDGDELTGVHWPSTLRTGEFVLRQRFRERDQRWLVQAHRGTTDPAAEAGRVRHSLERGLGTGAEVAVRVDDDEPVSLHTDDDVLRWCAAFDPHDPAPPAVPWWKRQVGGSPEPDRVLSPRARWTLSLASALAADPDATVELHVSGPLPDDPHLHALLRDQPRLTWHPIDEARVLAPSVRRVFDRIPTDHHAARSNVLRLALLHQRGGVYIDLDTFVLAPLTDLAPGAFAGLERVWASDRLRVEGRLPMSAWPATAVWGVSWFAKRMDTMALHGRARMTDRLVGIDAMLHTEQMNNAVLGATAGSAFTDALLAGVTRRNPHIRYALGPNLVHDTLAAEPRLATIMPPDVFYAVPPGESHRFFDDRLLELPPTAKAVHYVNSNHRKLLTSIRPDDPRFARPEIFWRLARRTETWMRTSPMAEAVA